MFARVFSYLLDFLYPKTSEIYALESLTPGELVLKLPPAPPLTDDTLAIFAYSDARVRELIWELKYRKNMRVLEGLAVVVHDVLCSELAERALAENFTHPLLVPIPQSHSRMLERGWNQTELLCEEVLKLLVPRSLDEVGDEKLFEYAPNVLHKIVHTESQTLTKNKKQRLHNLEGSMSADSSAQGRCIILIDDVTTTGATFTEARRALKASGARKILCLAIAH